MNKYIYLILLVVILLCACSDNDSLFKKALNLDKQGKTEQALQIYSQILKNEPDFYSALVNRAMLYDKLGDNKKAEADYRTAYEIYPRSTELLNNIGSFYLKIIVLIIAYIFDIIICLIIFRDIEYAFYIVNVLVQSLFVCYIVLFVYWFIEDKIKNVKRKTC